jgi:hypothetical protein
MYLIYASKEAAVERADKEGKEIGYSYWVHGRGTRWLTYPQETADGTWALDVTNYDLGDEEKASTVNNYTPLPSSDEL